MADMTLEETLCATAELTGTNMTPAGARLLAADLAKYPEAQVIGALRRCRMELRGRLTVEAIVMRLDDGRPTADEAWSIWPHTEGPSAILNNEIAESMETARFLLDEGDKVGARLAFRDAYNKRIQQGRDTGEPPQWFVSLGHNKQERHDVVLQAVKLGRISQDQAQAMLPAEYHPKVLEMIRREMRGSLVLENLS